MRRVLLAAAVGAALVAVRHDTRAADAGAPPPAASKADPARRALPVARIGDGTIVVGMLEDRLAALPPFQRAAFGSTDDEVRRRFLLEIMVPEWLFAMGAVEEKLDQQLPTAFDIERALSGAELRVIRDGVGPASAIPMSDVQAYYDAHRDHYDTPERIQVWRILCKTEDEARAVLDKARGDLDPKDFADLARDHSLDKATNLRGGNLGFLTPEGRSNEPGLRVDVAVVKAAQGVHDGQLVPSPVREGDAFAVVWRRGTVPANKRSVDDAAAQIRDALWKARVKDATDKLIASLRSAKLRDLDEKALDDLPAPALGDAGVFAARRDAGS